ncbi:hypothetical protein [Malonomonas rubra]|uniref:InlB B-repeat-containing protein n=1 Tax=Malonomonas rubra TaxID=57040 RepID=UPI0026F34262|nr:hypothetical protein [Malonomonas rubra]
MRSTIGYLVVFLLFITLPATSISAEGDLDVTFGTEGIVTTDVAGSEDRAYSMAIQTDAKILLTGYSSVGSNRDISLVRYNSDGSLDTSFDSDGMLTTDVASLNDGGYSVVLQPDGKILVGGYSEVNYSAQFALLRYNSDGSLDTSFHSDGIVTTDVGILNDYGQSVALQPDGKILFGGYSHNGSNNDMALLRYNSDGSLDTSFSSNGIVTTDISSTNDIARSVAIQEDGKILLAGYSNIGGSNDMALLRYNSDGSLDTSFNGTGIVTTDIGSGDNAYSLALQPGPDGKILLAGYSYLNNYSQIALLRYNSDGSLDTSFNTTGFVTTDINGYYDYALSIALQDDGKILVGGYSDNGSKNDMALLRYNSDGSLDTSFNTTGIVTTNVGGLNDGAYSVAIQGDGNILLAGYSNIGGNYDFALLRYLGATIMQYSVTPATGLNGSLTPDTIQLVYPEETVDFTVTPDTGYQIESVSGCGGSLNGITYTTATITGDCTVTATFSQVLHTLTVSVSGQGTVHSAPGTDMECTNNCTQDYTEGTLVTLTAAPATNYNFSGWAGNCSGTGDCLVTMNAAKNVAATFTVIPPNPVMLESSQASYMTMQNAYDGILSGQTDTIKIRAGEQSPENLYFDRDVTINLQGGYDAAFANVISDTSFYGTLTLSGDPVTISNLIIK